MTVAGASRITTAPPGVTGTDPRSNGVSQFVTSGLLAVGAGLIYLRSWATAQRNLVEPPEPFEPA